jgi:virulence factor
MDKLIRLAKNVRKQKYLNLEYSGQYAFVGIGSHSIENLYPVLHYLRVPLKYIVTRSSKNASAIDQHFNGVKGTNNLDEVLADPEIKGVFICANPSEHFSLVKQVLESGKHAFVEKPPCLNSTDLKALIAAEEKSAGMCLVGLQKRYAPCYEMLAEKMKDVLSYNLRYCTGPYPEGDAVTELFIHPLDLALNLFGEGIIESVQTTGNRKKGTYSVFVHLKHGSLVGNIELSTSYTWSRATETLSVNTPSGNYETTNAETLTFEDKLGSILTIPKEKIFGHQPTSTTLMNRNGFLPMWEHNPIYTAGFFDEISTFVQLCEGGKAKNNSSLKDLQNTYSIIEAIKQRIDV